MMSLAEGLHPRSVRPPRATSHESLAHSIAREVRARLPASGSISGLDASVERSMRAQAIHNELALAYVRAAAMGSVTLVALIGWLRPGLIGVDAVAGYVVPILAFCTFAALVLLGALRRGWYHTRLRQLVPAVDSLLIGLPVLLLAGNDAPGGAPSVPGAAALAGIACALLVFSGSVRLSSSAQRIATVLATATWLFAGFVLGIPVLIAAFAAGVLIVIGFMGTRFSSVVRAVVAQEIAGQNLERLYRDARSAIETREEVLRIVAHDLRNPISTIVMTADMLRDTRPDGDERAKYLGIISRCTHSMNRIVQDLLEVARMEAGRLQIEPVPLEVATLLEGIVELMRPIAEQHQLRLDVEPPAPGIWVHADPERLQQVFSNLVGNAIKFTPPGGSITLRAERAGDRVRFSVLDMGPGVPPERVEQLFERFWQANTGDRRGIGLGLAIARSIVEAHGGRIGVESRIGGGSEFWFSAPVGTESSAAKQNAADTRHETLAPVEGA